MSLTLFEDTNLPFLVTASPACRVLVDALKTKDLSVKVHVGLVPCTFYLTQSETDSLGERLSRYGPAGWRDENSPDLRTPYPYKEQVITISGKCCNMVPLPLTFKVAQGAEHQGFLTPLTYREIMSVRNVKRGWYKKPGFNVAYAALRAMIPNLTEIELACFVSGSCDDEQVVTGRNERAKHNRHLVEDRVYTDEVKCVKSYETQVSNGMKVYNFTLTCLDVDLEENTPDILEFMQKAMVV